MPPPFEGTDATPLVDKSSRLQLWRRNCIVEHDFTDPLWLATDGGSKHGCSSWAVAAGEYVIGAPIIGEDYTSVSAELHAALVALQAFECCISDPGYNFNVVNSRLLVIMDCKPAIAIIQRLVPPDDRWLLWQQLRATLDAILERCSVDFVWVPSHGKDSPSFRPPAGCSERLLRFYNDCADKAASRHLVRAAARSGRGEWHVMLNDAIHWAEASLKMAADIGDRFLEAS